MYTIKKLSINRILLILMFFSIYLFPYYFRKEFLNSFADINFLFIFLLFIFLLINRKNINYKKFILITIIIIYIIIIDFLANNDPVDSIIKNLFMYIIPIYLSTVELNSKKIKFIYSGILNTLNFFVIIIFIIGVIDPFIDFNIMKTLSNLFFCGIKDLVYENVSFTKYRYASYMGHALVTKEIFLYFYFLNIIYYKTFNEYKLNNRVVTIISLVGVLLTGSKTGTIVLIISIVFTNYRKNKILNFLYSLIIILGAYFLGFFNSLIYRMNTETLTSGRYLAGEILKNLDFLKIKFFYGYGEYADRRIADVMGDTLTTAALEYPYKILNYKYGVFCTILIYIAIFLLPAFRFLKEKQYYLLFAFVMKAIDINTYNGMIFKPDNMILFVLFSMILINVSNIKKGDYNV